VCIPVPVWEKGAFLIKSEL